MFMYSNSIFILLYQYEYMRAFRFRFSSACCCSPSAHTWSTVPLQPFNSTHSHIGLYWTRAFKTHRETQGSYASCYLYLVDTNVLSRLAADLHIGVRAL